MKNKPNYIETKLQEFDEEFVVRNYEADAHAWDIHINDRPEEIERWIIKLLEEQAAGFEKIIGDGTPQILRKDKLEYDTGWCDGRQQLRKQLREQLKGMRGE